MMRTSRVAVVALLFSSCAVSTQGEVSGKPLVASDAHDNLHLNASVGKVLVNGGDLSAAINDYQMMMQQMQSVWSNISAVSDRVEWHIRQTRSPTASPSTSTPTVPPTNIPTTTPSAFPTPDFSITYNGVQYSNIGDSFSIVGGTREVKKLTIHGVGRVKIEAAGSNAGRGQWNNNDHVGAPGGRVTALVTLAYKTPTPVYAFVAEAGAEVAGSAGGGGGSTDLRDVYDGSLTSVTDTTFLNKFLAKDSLDSRIIVAGGGGGAHGGTYGYWGYQNSPGAGGPDRASTNSKGNNDGGHTNTGATVDTFGLDGGASQSSTYTGSGRYGMGGQASNGAQYAKYFPTSTRFSGMTWPNGGSGTSWANGGGGGGYYGGAGNWPNGGGGSNFVAKHADVLENVGAENEGAGYLTITIVSTRETPPPTPAPTGYKPRTVKYLGYASWGQTCAQTEEDQDNQMNAACDTKYGTKASAATYYELVKGTIQDIPTTNDSGQYLIFALPEPPSCNDHRSGNCDDTARNCVKPNAAMPTECGTWVGWETNCHTSGRSTMCVEEV